MKVKTSKTKSQRFGRAEANIERPEKVTRRSANIEGDRDATISKAANEAARATLEIQPHALTVPQTNFEGLSSLDNAANPAIGGFIFPPDTVGDVGPNHYVQATNLLFRVFTKAGAPLTPTQPISALFTAMGGRCATTDNGDPIVLYDSFADRWIVTQFVVDGAAPLGQCFAISQTPDPTGAYYTYDFVYPVNKFNDYPKFGVWPDGYYFTVNQFTLPGVAPFRGVGVGAFDRAKVLAGDPTASQIFFDLESSFPFAASLLPSDADGLVPPPANAPNIMSYFAANEFGDPEGDALVFFAFDADFAVPANSTFTPQGFVPVAAFNPLTPPGLDDIEQPAPAAANAALDAVGDRLMHRLQYRRIGAEEVLAVNHTVNAGTGTTLATYRAGVRYYELRRMTGNIGLFAIRNQQTYAPGTDTHERWMASAATDNQGNLALGYSIVDGSLATPLFPGIRYTGRTVNAAANTLDQTEQTLQAGSGVQTNAGSRWGDYSSLNVDPNDDCTFFYTQEYYQTTDPPEFPLLPPFGVNWQTRIGSFRFTECTAPPKGTLIVNVTDCDNGQPIEGAAITIDNNLYGTVLANGSFSTQLTPGTYTVTISAPNSTGSVTRTVTITNGGTTTLNECLSGVSDPDPVGAGLTLVSESCPPANGGADPGERVTVSLAVRNRSDFASMNLTGTLQASANVLAPSGPQNYDNIPPGGTASRNFTFTVNGTCGDTITLTLQLEGEVSRTVTYTLPLGGLVTSPVFSENFDSVTPPALPAGWTTVVTGTPPATPTPTPAPPAPWRTINTPASFVDTPPNSAATTDNRFVATSSLISPTIAIPASSGANSGAQLTFKNFFNLEPGFDGGVLEISISGGAFQDVIAAGGSFVTGGYTGTLSTGFGNPLPGRQAWTGNSGGFITSIVNLPNSAEGQNVQFRWRMGNDNEVEVANGGWRIDTISISSADRVCNTACAGAPASAPLQCSHAAVGIQSPTSL